MTNDFRPAFVLFIFMTLVTGGLYPWIVTELAQKALPEQANGSLIYRGKTLVGSALIGQSFTDPRHFSGRPSATAPQANNGLASGGSNLGPTNPALLTAVAGRVTDLKAQPVPSGPIPTDLVTASASGLDPDISPAAAAFQIPRIAKLRGMKQEQLQALVEKHTKGPQFGFIGPARVNVLELNLDLDAPG